MRRLGIAGLLGLSTKQAITQKGDLLLQLCDLAQVRLTLQQHVNLTKDSQPLRIKPMRVRTFGTGQIFN